MRWSWTSRRTKSSAGWRGRTWRMKGCRLMRISSWAISCGGRIMSTEPVAMAARGMPSYLAVLGSWARVMPPTALISRSPAAAVARRPGEDDADGVRPGVLGQRAEKGVDRHVLRAVLGPRHEVEGPIGGDAHVEVRRDHVNAIGLDPHGLGDLDDGHLGGGGEELGEYALVGGGEVLDEDDGHAGVVGEVLEEQLEGFESAGGGADGDDGEVGFCGVGGGVGFGEFDGLGGG